MKHILFGLICSLTICLLAVPAEAQAERHADVTYMDQPTGIELSAYLVAWPNLAPYVARLKASQARAVEADLRGRAGASDVSDGELNLLAQLEWQHGDLDAAYAAADRATFLQPKQSLNWYQLAMVDFAYLRQASGENDAYQNIFRRPWAMLDQWKWQRRTWDAYQHAFDLNPRNVSARYYLAYSYMNTPSIGGGDLNKALELSEGGIALGQNGFYAVRADAHRLRGEFDAANSDYDTTIRLKVIKLGGLLDAAEEELGRNHLGRAKRYLVWAVYCYPDAAKAHEDLGDYYIAAHEREQARQSYETAIQRNPGNESAKAKLAGLSRAH